MIITESSCCGCMACAASCPYDAIKVKIDEEGFYKPEVNDNLCKKCKKCINVCPLNKIIKDRNNLDESKHSDKCFACYAKNFEIRAKSSSGGIFRLLADEVISKKGYICGAIVDSDLVVRHTLCAYNDHELIAKMSGSKYVQSEIKPILLREIKNKLSQGFFVLFSGTPCQVSGLNSYLGKKYSNLISVDFVCHGVPSPGILKLYLEENIDDLSNVGKITFRDKAYGWHSVKLCVTDKLGNTLINERIGENPYLKAFQQGSILNYSCHHCRYANTQRVSDITIGDFWGIKDLDNRFCDNYGTSLVIPNTTIGQSYFSKIQSRLGIKQEFDLQNAVKYQGNLRRPTKKNVYRSNIFHHYKTCMNLKKHGLKFNTYITLTDELSRLFLPVGILNFFDADNFGAVLVPYSISRILRNLGYNSEIINFRYHPDKEPNSNFQSFRERFLTLSTQGSDYEFLHNILHRYQNIITGSDQVFRMRDTNKYMLNWVSGKKRILSYAASFGTSSYQGKISKSDAKYLLERFDSISVREEEGVKICSNDFNIFSQQLIDPVLMMSPEDLEPIIETCTNELPEESYVDCIFLGPESRKKILKDKKIASDIKQKYQFVNGVRNQDGTLRSVPEYLKLIKNSKFILTNSFHGLVLSIIFKKNFIAVVNLDPSRQLSLLNLLSINQSKLVPNLEDISLQLLEAKIDYDTVSLNLNELKFFSYLYLNKILHKPIIYKKPVDITTETKLDLNTRDNFSISVMYCGNQKKWSILNERNVMFEFSKSFSNNYCTLNNEVVSYYEAYQLQIFFKNLLNKKYSKAINDILKISSSNKNIIDLKTFVITNWKN